MRAALFETPRPVPGKLIPALGGALVIALALPVFLLLDARLAGWALAAVLWVGVQALDLLLARLKARTGNLAASAVQAFGLFFKAVGLLVILVAAAVSDPHLAVAAAITYALAYTLELALSLAAFFGGAR